MLWKNHGNRDPMMVAQEVVEEENAPVFRVVPEVIIEAADKAESVDEIVSVIAENIQIVDNNADIETETIQMFADMSNEEVEISQDSDSILTLDEVAFTGSAPVASEVSLRHNRREMLEKSIAAPTSVHAVSADSLRAAEAFRRYLDEVSHTLEGRVTLEFWSDGNGRPTKIRVVDGLSVSRKAKQAAISLLRESPIVWPPRKTMKVVLE